MADGLRARCRMFYKASGSHPPNPGVGTRLFQGAAVVCEGLEGVPFA